MKHGSDAVPPEKKDFIRQIVRDDLASGKPRHDPHALPARAQRLPAHRPRQGDLPELRHRRASSAAGCNLRLDDTNPAKEDPEFVAGIKDDVRWLGFDWHELRHASDYFEVFYLAAREADPTTARPSSDDLDRRARCAPTAAR